MGQRSDSKALCNSYFKKMNERLYKTCRQAEGLTCGYFAGFTLNYKQKVTKESLAEEFVLLLINVAQNKLSFLLER